MTACGLVFWRRVLVLLALICVAGTVTATPPPRPRTDNVGAALRSAIDVEIAAHRLPGAVVLLGRQGERPHIVVDGLKRVGPRRAPLSADTIFDLASLTKVVATTVAVMQLVETGRLALDHPVAEYWPAFGAEGKEAIRVQDLLLHTAGLAPDLPLSPPWSGEAGALAQIEAARPRTPAGARFVYSDIDFIVLGELVHRVSGEPLDDYARRHIFAPLGMADTSFQPSSAKRRRIAPTGAATDRVGRGAVQDPIAARMGGVAGHAGLFSTAADLGRFCEMILGNGTRRDVRILRPESVALMTRPYLLPGGVRRALGWDVASEYSEGIADALGPASFGHTGYTGTMLWIDPRTRSYVVVLSSRLYPAGKGDARPLRRAVAMIAEASAAPTPTQPGIDVLALAGFAPLVGKRIGLLTNQAGRSLDGERTIDILAHASGVQLSAIFTPEHGLGADREGPIESGRDVATDVPIHSLYGAGLRPDAASLDGLQALVIDLQDAGVRFYTYASTVGYMLEEAAKRGIEVLVLDRPNPIDAEVVQGPVLDSAQLSFTGYFPMPLRHGMTLGELATMFNDEKRLGVKLRVIRMLGYRRRLWYDQTGLPWTPPSPNLRTVQAAILYSGVGLIEGADVSVGRGTATPFELVGAPWIDSRKFAAGMRRLAIPGVSFGTTDFTPEADRFARQVCHGVRITVIDRSRFDAARLGLGLAATLQHLYPDAFDLRAIGFSVGSPAVIDGLARGQSYAQLQQTWDRPLQAFLAVRRRHLLYAEWPRDRPEPTAP